MKLMKVFSILSFFLVTAVHLYASWKKDQKLRNYTKPFIIPPLLLYYLISVERPLWSVNISLLTAWIGDLLLMKKGKKFFLLGGISFLLAHVFLIHTYIRETDLRVIPVWFLIALFIFFSTASLIIFWRLSPHLKGKMLYLMFAYLLVNGIMNCFAWYRALYLGGFAGIITGLGALLFYISDAVLFFVRFDKDCRLKTHFLVMITYAFGKFLIVAGLVLAQGGSLT